MTNLRITVDGARGDVESLYDWLCNEPQLRGHVRQAALPTPAGAMGSLTELVVEGLVTGSLGTAINVLAQSLTTWLRQRRTRSTITVTTANGHTVAIDTRNAADAHQLLQTLASPADTPSAETPRRNA